MSTHLGFIEKRIPYPLRAAKLSIQFTIFPWLKPRFVNRSNISEQSKKDGNTIWYARFLWIQINYSRWS